MDRNRFIITALLLFATFTARPQGYTFTHFAGAPGGPGVADGPGPMARFNGPQGVAADTSGVLYVADGGNHTIRKISPTGVVTTFAGCPGVSGSDDGLGAAARFNHPVGVAVDPSGTLYVADCGNNTIRRISPAGVVTTCAGLALVQGTNDGIGSTASFNSPQGVTVDHSGNVYVADSWNDTIRKITPAGEVTTISGSPGAPGADDGVGNAARFNSPCGIAVDQSGTLYVADSLNETIRKISSGGQVTTLAGLAGAAGSDDGVGNAARFNYPVALALDASGVLYVADMWNSSIRAITPAGEVTTFAGAATSWGSADGTGAAAQFYGPFGVAVDPAGNVYVADSDNQAIRKLSPSAVVTTFAGAPPGLGSVDATGTAARFNHPQGLAVDAAQNLYVADSDNQTIRKITAGGEVTTLAGLAGVSGSDDGNGSSALFYHPSGVAVDLAGNVYVADNQNSTIRKITPLGDVTTLAGLAGVIGSDDGFGSAARFHKACDVAVDLQGYVYVADFLNDTIRKISPAGEVTTFAGLAGVGGNVDGLGSAARFNWPTGVAVDGAGMLYVADHNNGTIRKITPAGLVSTVTDATGNTPYFEGPNHVAVDSLGNIYVPEEGLTVKKITPGGIITTLGGKALVSGSEDGTGQNARFDWPLGIAVDSSGILYVSEFNNCAIRKAFHAPIPTLSSPVRVANAQFQFSVSTVPGAAYWIERSSGVNSWLSLDAFIATGGIASFLDTNAAEPQLLYRIRLQ